MKKISKRNIYLLLVFVVTMLFIVVNKTYAKFPSSYTTGDNIVGLVLDFNVGITNIEEYQEIDVEAGESKEFNVKITNNIGSDTSYGVWYRMVEPNTINSNIEIGRLKGSSTTTSGTIGNNNEVVVTIVINNKTTSNIKIDVGVATPKSGSTEIEYINGKKLITGEISEILMLADVKAGSYVKYVGSNGCSGKACEGQNANYVSDTDMGWCTTPDDGKFKVNGWRVVYSKYNSAYITSAGAPECYGGNNSITPYANIRNINNLTLKYCNPNYAYGGKCDSNSTWNIYSNDFEEIMGKSLRSCHANITDANNNDPSCGYGNDLIDTGSSYRFATEKGIGAPYSILRWRSNWGRVAWNVAEYSFGIRPVIRLKKGVYVTGGSGTYKDPYTIAVPIKEEVVTSIKITYDSNGGSACSPSTKTVTIGGTYGNLCTPTRSGYVFIGWFDDTTYRDRPLYYYCDMFDDLFNAFLYDEAQLYEHWVDNGQGEGRRISQYLATDRVEKTSDLTLYAGWYYTG